MLRKSLTIVCVLLILLSANGFADMSYYHLDDAESGVVVVTYPVEKDVRYKIMLQKDEKKYYYDLISEAVRLPLQMGEGTYTIAILKHEYGITYSYDYETTFDVKSIKEEQLYLNSIVNIDWNEENDSISFLEQLLENNMSDTLKVEMIHEYLAESLSYDSDKYSAIEGAYLPDIDDIFESKSGICYDFSSLLASLLRSEGIQTKLVMGYRADTSVYHAWNEVYLNDEWQIIDLTLDIQYFQKGYMYELFKDAFFYDVHAEY